uniref:2-dehydropantoate 2-reductase n=1 Tax=Magnetococcus massalia (strain MO-1) TaxID=451514 RepID=A0A1S7LPN8_MAGMO|nr:Putative 2-dehydropantoate 2-reductase [Candidatus Magnetococcus massalia]
MTSQLPRILIVGAGAIGGYYGAKLAQSGAEVSVVSRSDYAAVKQHGITIESFSEGRFHFKPAHVCRHVADYPGTPDYMLITLKVLPEIDLRNIVGDKIGPNTTLVLIQNGVEIEAPIHQALPTTPLISSLAFICVSRTAPGHIEHLCFGHLAMGCYPPAPATPELKQLAELFSQNGVEAAITDDVVNARWKKLVWNAPFNAISVLGGGLTTTDIMADEALVVLCEKVMQEVVVLAAAAGSPLPADVVEKNLANTRKMKPYRTSMLLDYEHGRPMEVDAILGRAIAAARRLQVSLPHMQTLHALLAAKAQRQERPSTG